MDLYCVACHNREDKTAGLALDAISSEDVSRNPEAWEKVVRKLVARQMPPEDEVRPSRRTYDAFVSLLAGSLDRAAAAEPRSRPDRDLPAAEPDRVPERHPRPPGARHRRLGAAAERRVQPRVRQRDGGRPLADAPGPLHHRGAEDQPPGRRAARAGRPGGDTIRIRPDLTQEEHVEGLPIGTRGGALIPYTFPQDGEYEIQLRLARDRNEHVEGLREPHELEVLLDRERRRRSR